MSLPQVVKGGVSMSSGVQAPTLGQGSRAQQILSTVAAGGIQFDPHVVALDDFRSAACVDSLRRFWNDCGAPPGAAVFISFTAFMDLRSSGTPPPPCLKAATMIWRMIFTRFRPLSLYPWSTYGQFWAPLSDRYVPNSGKP
ncbi:hypothetical protein D4764_17G0001740 [Takifugu flavidus]|uniref:Uncharacterized protein n=1 Tax=Takifugu flavidus TaxID=433684 RepID=A0A5C6NVS6_9TELE|nr:hypothetical protein D4764_17G0001740 [Takifugu flavidus]